MNKLPSNFKTYASAPTLTGIHKNIKMFYGGESNALQESETPGIYRVLTLSGRILSTVVCETSRGWYFGTMEAAKEPASDFIK